ncbi:MAG TPA: hypothetical protein GXZ77_02085 [Papillibacter sp.]|jgi:hypothetical protein|nr:hypothetical protein [Papillibacter sp.]
MKKSKTGPIVLGFVVGTAVYAVALVVSLTVAQAISHALNLGDLFFIRDGAVAAALAAVCTNKPALFVFGLFSKNAPAARIVFCKFLMALAVASAVYALAIRGFFLLFYPAMSLLLCAMAMHREMIIRRVDELDDWETAEEFDSRA